VTLKDVPQDDLLIHDETADNPSHAFMLSRMRHPEVPEPLGIFRQVIRPVYGDLVRGQISDAVKSKGPGDLQSLITGHETWTVD
jgi:2-oxoglutarate/2-oxoacid ferredoxin oxidoreductase subunit beta